MNMEPASLFHFPKRPSQPSGELVMSAVCGSNSRGTRSRARDWTGYACVSFIRRCSCQALYGIHERGFVANVEGGLGAVDLPHQSAENFSWADFDECLHALRNQQANALLPFHRSRNLPDECVAGAQIVGDQLGVHV